MFLYYQLKIADDHDISIGNVKKLVHNFFNKGKLQKLCVRLGLKMKKAHRVLEFDQSKWLKPSMEFNTHKITEAEKMVTKMEKPSTN